MDIKNRIYKNLLWVLLFVVAVLIFLYVAAVFWNFKNKGMYIFPPVAPGTMTEMGQLGDYFGGLLNPFFGVITLFFVGITFVTQKQQLDIAKKEHKINLLQNEFRYLFSEISTSLEKSGFRPANALSSKINEFARDKNLNVTGDLKHDNFSYYKLACLIMREEDGVKQKEFSESFKEEICVKLFVSSRLVIYCKSAYYLKEVSSQLINLLDELSGVKLNITSEVEQVEEIFDALNIDYIQTAIDGRKIIWK